MLACLITECDQAALERVGRMLATLYLRRLRHYLPGMCIPCHSTLAILSQVQAPHLPACPSHERMLHTVCVQPQGPLETGSIVGDQHTHKCCCTGHAPLWCCRRMMQRPAERQLLL